MRPYLLPASLLLAAGLVIGFGNKVELPSLSGWVTPAVKVEGTTLLMVHEKLAPPISEVLMVREAPGFVEANKLSGFLDVDKDDDYSKPFTDYAATKKISPPYFAFVDLKDKNRVVKLVVWPKTDIKESLR